MNKNYKLNLEQSEESIPLSKLKSSHQRNRRKNELLNGFVFIIAAIGLFYTYSAPSGLIYNSPSLASSFKSDNYRAETSSFQMTKISENAQESGLDTNFRIEGFFEAVEPLNFQLASFQPNSEVIYTIHFGDKTSAVISEKSTLHQYAAEGSYNVRVTAKYQEETKEIFKRRIEIEDAIFVNSEAFTEVN